MRLLLVVATVLLLAAACSGSGKKVSSTASPTASPTMGSTLTRLPTPTPGTTVAGLDLNSLSPEARRAAEVAIAPGHGFTAVATAVSLESYRDLMCGRQPYAVPDVPVWAVAIRIASRMPISIPPGATVTPWPPADTMLWIIDASNYVSLQTFSPWPIDRAPGSNCP